MKNVLFVSYYFPPIGGAGVQRAAKFVKYLPQFGWRPIVLTTMARDYVQHREFQFDESLSDDVKNCDCEVHRLRDPEPRALRALLEKFRVFRLFWFVFYALFWEREFFWALAAIPRALRLARTRKASVVYTNSAPYSLILLGFAIKRMTGLPWVADLRDLWTQDGLGVWPSRWHYRLTARVERALLRRADVVIGNTRLAAERLRALLGPTHEKRVIHIPNGYDPDDLPVPERKTSSPDAPLLIAHVGTLHAPRASKSGSGLAARARRALRGAGYRPFALDPTMRTPMNLLKAIQILRARQPELRGKVRLLFVGYLQRAWRERIREMALGDVVEIAGYLPHGRAVRRSAEADALFCVQVGFRDAGKRVPYVPAKLYEYLATGKPILAPVAEGDTKEVLRESGLGFFADPRDPEDIARVLMRLCEQHNTSGIAVKPNWDFIRRFERRELTRRLAAVLDGCSSRSPEQGSLNQSSGSEWSTDSEDASERSSDSRK